MTKITAPNDSSDSSISNNKPLRPEIKSSDYKRISLPEKEKEFHNNMKSFGSSNNHWSDSASTKSKIINITDSFLNNCRHEKTEILMVLNDNTEEKGIIIAFDHSAIIMNNEMHSQFLVMKTSIMKIVPLKCVNYIFGDNNHPFMRDGKIY